MGKMQKTHGTKYSFEARYTQLGYSGILRVYFSGTRKKKNKREGFRPG